MARCNNCGEVFKQMKVGQKYCRKEECFDFEIKRVLEKQQKAKEKAWNRRKKKMEIEVKPKKYKDLLQKNINKLARMIDAKFGYFSCIDCNKPFGNQCDGGHFNSVGSNPTLRWNLHNIHSQKSDCNRNGLGGGRRLEYFRGLVDRYGQSYAEMVDTGLQIKYKVLHLSNQEIYDIYIETNKIIREFDNYPLKSSVQARNYINDLIGIYN